MQARGGVRARQIAEKFWTAPDDALVTEYQEVCMPLYNPQPNPADAVARRRAIRRTAVMSHFILGEMRSMDLSGGLSAIHVPTLILAGAHDPITPVACSEEIAGALPEGVAELHVFENAGHGVHRDEPDRAEAVLRRFMG